MPAHDDDFAVDAGELNSESERRTDGQEYVEAYRGLAISPVSRLHTEECIQSSVCNRVNCRDVTKIGQLAQELARTNPWWRDASWHERDPDLSESRSGGVTYRSNVLAGLSAGCLYILRGPRRVGKTVAVKQEIENLLASGTPATSIVRVAADGWDAKDLRTLLQNTALPLSPIGQQRYWFIDEVSAVVGQWDQQITWLRDNDHEFRAATVVLTGSNATALTAAAGALAGRRGAAGNLDRTLLPIGFRAFVKLVKGDNAPTASRLPMDSLHTPLAGDTYRALLPWLDDLVDLWETYILRGGFPKSVVATVRGESIPEGFIEDLFHVVSADAFKTSASAHSPKWRCLNASGRPWHHRQT